MTREKAITLLGKLRTFHNGTYAKSIDMAIEALEEIPKRRKEAKRWKRKALQGKSINCNYTCSDCVHQNKAYEEEPCHSCFNNDGIGYEPNCGAKMDGGV